MAEIVGKRMNMLTGNARTKKLTYASVVTWHHRYRKMYTL